MKKAVRLRGGDVRHKNGRGSQDAVMEHMRRGVRLEGG